VIYVDMGEVRLEAPGGSYASDLEMYDRRTAFGLRVARGEILALLRDYEVPAPDYCEQVLQAHQLPHGVIGGAIEHAGRSTLNWAAYYIDFGRYQLPLKEGYFPYLSDANVTYKREVLEPIRNLWEDRYLEVIVNWELAKRGVMLWLRPQIVVWQDWGELHFKELLTVSYSFGRLFGSTRARSNPIVKRLFYILISPLIPLVIMGRIARKVFKSKRKPGQFIQTIPYLVMLSVFLAFGEFIGYVTGKDSS
jgi:hypothetical protein